MDRKRGNGRLINLESAVSTSKTCEIWHSTRGARNPVRSRRRTLQNVHTHVKLCPPPGRKRVVSYHHSQGTTKLQGQGPGTGGETAVRACSVGTAAFAYCPPAVGADKQHHASRVLKIEGIKSGPELVPAPGRFLCLLFSTRGRRGVVCLPPQPGGSMQRRPFLLNRRGRPFPRPFPALGLAASSFLGCDDKIPLFSAPVVDKV